MLSITIIAGALLSLFKIFEWGGWISITAILTVILLWRQTKYLNYTVRPIAWFILISPNTFFKKNPSLPRDNRTRILISNGSKFKILFYIYITLKSGGKTRVQSAYWKDNDNPLHIYPNGMIYPDVLNTMEDFTDDEKKNLVAEIKYAMAPSHASSEIYEGRVETWRFNGNNWVGPNGMSDEGAFH